MLLAFPARRDMTRHCVDGAPTLLRNLMSAAELDLTPDILALQVFFKVLMGCRPTIPEHMPEPFVKLMMECWDTDPEKRPTFEEILRRLQV